MGSIYVKNEVVKSTGFKQKIFAKTKKSYIDLHSFVNTAYGMGVEQYNQFGKLKLLSDTVDHNGSYKSNYYMTFMNFNSNDTDKPFFFSIIEKVKGMDISHYKKGNIELLGTNEYGLVYGVEMYDQEEIGEQELGVFAINHKADHNTGNETYTVKYINGTNFFDSNELIFKSI